MIIIAICSKQFPITFISDLKLHTNLYIYKNQNLHKLSSYLNSIKSTNTTMKLSTMRTISNCLNYCLNHTRCLHSDISEFRIFRQHKFHECWLVILHRPPTLFKAIYTGGWQVQIGELSVQRSSRLSIKRWEYAVG